MIYTILYFYQLLFKTDPNKKTAKLAVIIPIDLKLKVAELLRMLSIIFATPFKIP